ncbi:hypothetical protein KC315_g40 [Hortaea werneckii]|nr:hypothetical protein KC315_g40 [Hortaea werneckii]
MVLTASAEEVSYLKADTSSSSPRRKLRTLTEWIMHSFAPGLLTHQRHPHSNRGSQSRQLILTVMYLIDERGQANHHRKLVLHMLVCTNSPTPAKFNSTFAKLCSCRLFSKGMMSLAALSLPANMNELGVSVTRQKIVLLVEQSWLGLSLSAGLRFRVDEALWRFPALETPQPIRLLQAQPFAGSPDTLP